MKKLRFAVFGTGFWSGFQIPGWLESPDVELVALCDKNKKRAREIGSRFGVNRIYDDPRILLEQEQLDFVDIITDVDTHLEITKMVAPRGLHVVCQKPMASSFQDCKALLSECQSNNVKLFINENFRWQAPIRRVKQILDSGAIGRAFKGRISFCSAFPVFNNQPFLKELDRFIITDVGSHTLDIARFLFGETKDLRCLTQTVNPSIKGDDVANILMEMENGLHCFVEMSYASLLEKEVFPQTLILIEGEKGSIHLTADYEVKVTTDLGTTNEIVEPKLYDWIDPDYAVIHSSIVDAQTNIIKGLKNGGAETTGEDNLETARLVWAAYHSAEYNQIVDIKQFK